MLNIEVKDNGECKIVISGDEKQCAFQMSQVAKHIFKQNPLIADSFLFGLASERTKEQMLNQVERAYTSIEMGKVIKSNLDDKAIEKIVQDLMKNICGGGNNE